jgi:hypothetical protein
MASDTQWVEDVRRWCSGEQPRRTEPAHPHEPAGPDDSSTLGYEAAHPALQACHWPDAPVGDVKDPMR